MGAHFHQKLFRVYSKKRVDLCYSFVLFYCRVSTIYTINDQNQLTTIISFIYTMMQNTFKLALDRGTYTRVVDFEENKKEEQVCIHTLISGLLVLNDFYFEKATAARDLFTTLYGYY
jgi:hypothetical protein